MSKTKNGIGWQVQFYSEKWGWVSCSAVYATKKAAQNGMEDMYNGQNNKNLRVYEALS